MRDIIVYADTKDVSIPSERYFETRRMLKCLDIQEGAMDALLIGTGFALGYATKQPEAKDVAYIHMKGDPDFLRKTIDHAMDETE